MVGKSGQLAPESKPHMRCRKDFRTDDDRRKAQVYQQLANSPHDRKEEFLTSKKENNKELQEADLRQAAFSWRVVEIIRGANCLRTPACLHFSFLPFPLFFSFCVQLHEEPMAHSLSSAASFVLHPLETDDTLPAIALYYGVTVRV